MNIILVGKAASGKDYFKNYLLENSFKTSISHTTRPMRKGEVNGETYHFVSEDEFISMIDNQNFFEYKKFNGWYYGTSEKEIKDSQVFIFTPSGVKDLPRYFLNESIIIYFDISKDVRIERLKKRSDSDSIERRLKADKEDFKDFFEYDFRVFESNFSCEELLNAISL